MHHDLTIDYIVIFAYLVFLIVVGWVQRKRNQDVSDYFRSGCKATWWMVGASAFMSGVSAYTFTAASGVAFEAGWSVMVIYLANTAAFVVNAIAIGPWFRQLRMITFPEVVRARFGPTTQQFYAWVMLLQYLVTAALPLYALALFCSSVFGLNLYLVIIAVGVVVLMYSVVGGRWGVMATDFLQSLIMMAMTVLVTGLCLVKIGGIGELLGQIQAGGLAERFAMVKPRGAFDGNAYTLWWAAAIFLNQIIAQNSLVAAPRYFSAKDGREARKAAILSAVLMLVGSVLWFVPPVIARLLYAPEVQAMGVPKPAETAYAVVVLQLLPPGLLGLMVVSMFAATMSSLDTGLNVNAAIFTRDIYPALCRLFGMPGLEDRALLRLSQAVSFVFGVSIIGFALLFATQQGVGIFEIMLSLLVMFALPLALPLMLCLLVRKVPQWSALVTALAMYAVSLIGLLSDWLFGEAWNFQTKVFVSVAVGIGVFLIGRALWWTSTMRYRREVRQFFALMHRPVDFQREVGQASDAGQLQEIGGFAVAGGGFVLLLMLLPIGLMSRLAVLFIAGWLLGIGALMWLAGRRILRTNRSR